MFGFRTPSLTFFMAQAFEYLVTGAIPEIDAEPDDVLVWKFPRVALVRWSEDRAVVREIRLMPGFWSFLFLKYDDRLTPFFGDAPPLHELAALSGLPRPLPPMPRGTGAASRASHLRLLPPEE